MVVVVDAGWAERRIILCDFVHVEVPEKLACSCKDPITKLMRYMKASSLAVRTAGVLLFLLGSQVWSLRLSFSPESEITSRLGESLKEVRPGTVSDLTNECDVAKSETGWMVFVLNADLINDNLFRTYFETAEERIGLWVEQDNGLLRIGLGLGPTGPVPNTDLPIRLVRRNERAVIVIGVTRNEVRVITNNRDSRTRWPAESAATWSCARVQFANDSRELSEGNDCKRCNIELFYSSGTNQDDIRDLMNSISNVQRFNVLRSFGILLSVTGISLIFGLGNSLPRFARRKT